MKNILSLPILLVLICLGSLSAQTFLKHSFPLQNNGITNSGVNDTLKILAVMVEFQYSKDATTTGHGKFDSIYTKSYGNKILDPLPHNKNYFSAHLEFSKNYFNKVSNNNLHIQYEVLPTVITVSKNMKGYSPPIKSTDFSLMVDFSEEVWLAVAAAYPNLDFRKYQLFSIFHAGVGRDIILPGSIGNERDLPSVYLGLNTLKKYRGQSFDGFTIGNAKITNSMILPQTQNREVSSFSGKHLFQITINGLLVSSIASHLGLPDLFDTKTGLSAIGKFGLMDGQSIFAYNGIYPPEPSAWEKIYLGWANPIVLSTKNADIKLASKLSASLGDTVIVKVPINETEYYLIENRRRDALKNGSVLTIWNNGTIQTKTFAKDTSGYYSYSVDSVGGVVINVDEFDWAVPGNGIVIWHIDEKVINEKLASNEINNDKNRRGVDVEEADGIQDIGKQYQTIFGDVVIGEGTVQDFWFAKNNAKLYKNVFDAKSLPNTNSNSGAKSLIRMFNFSDTTNIMSFRIEFGDSIIKHIFTGKDDYLGDIKEVKVVATTLGNVFITRLNNDIHLQNSWNANRSTLSGFSESEIAAIHLSNKLFVVGALGSKIKFYENASGIVQTWDYELFDKITSAPVFVKTETEQLRLFVGTEKGKLIVIDLAQVSPLNSAVLKIDSIASKAVKWISANKNYYAYLTQTIDNANPHLSVYDYHDSNGKNYSGQGQVNQFVLSKNKRGNYQSILLLDGKTFRIYENNILYSSFELSEKIKSFSIADIKRNGENYLIYSSSNSINAVNYEGVNAENFPVKIDGDAVLSDKIITADFAGDGFSEIVTLTNDGRLFAFDGNTGKTVNGFPIAIDATNFQSASFFMHDRNSALAVLTPKGKVTAFQIGATEGLIQWNGNLSNGFNSNFIDAASSVYSINTFFPKNKAYNYPNPVYDGKTFIRYFVNEDAKISIKIFDLAGDYVAELSDYARGGFDNETAWEVSNIQSGIYLARIEAAGISGKTESTIIKIAIVK